MSLGLITELEAVNMILAASGDSPVLTLEGSYLQANLAQTELSDASRSLQGKGWYFNEEEGVPLTPDINNKTITLPVNCVEAIVEHYNGGKIIQRGNQLYNRTDRTYEFDEVVNADLLLRLSWDLLPEVAREVAIHQASISFINNFVGDQNLLQPIGLKLNDAYQRLMNADAQSRNVSMLENTTAYNIAFNRRR